MELKSEYLYLRLQLAVCMHTAETVNWMMCFYGMLYFPLLPEQTAEQYLRFEMAAKILYCISLGSLF